MALTQAQEDILKAKIAEWQKEDAIKLINEETKTLLAPINQANIDAMNLLRTESKKIVDAQQKKIDAIGK
jgi:hypothetical protein